MQDGNASNDRFENEFNDDDLHFTDEELESAMAGFEAEFADDIAGVGTSGGADTAKSAGDAADAANADTNADVADVAGDFTIPEDASALFEDAQKDPEIGFDDELQGLLGNKAKAAMIITRLTSPELLAAFCQLSDISALCIGADEGAVAVLRNLTGDGPEAAARDMTVVVSGMPVVLAVNRADKLEANMYVEGKAVQSFPPPVLFSSAARFVEDLMLGIADVESVRVSGATVLDSADFDRESAMKVIAEHTRFGRGGSRIE